MAAIIEQYDHPAWLTAFGTVIGWLLMLAIVTILLFALPLVLWP